MSTNQFQTAITSNLIALQSSQVINDEKVHKSQPLRPDDEDEDDLDDLVNGGWEDDFTDEGEEDVEDMKEWEKLEFLWQISKPKSISLISNHSNGRENGKVVDHDEGAPPINPPAERNEKSTEENGNSEIKTDETSSTSIITISSVNNINRPSLSIPKLNIENRKRKASESDDDEIDISMILRKTKKQKDGDLETSKIPKSSPNDNLD